MFAAEDPLVVEVEAPLVVEVEAPLVVEVEAAPELAAEAVTVTACVWSDTVLVSPNVVPPEYAPAAPPDPEEEVETLVPI